MKRYLKYFLTLIPNGCGIYFEAHIKGFVGIYNFNNEILCELVNGEAESLSKLDDGIAESFRKLIIVNNLQVGVMKETGSTRDLVYKGSNKVGATFTFGGHRTKMAINGDEVDCIGVELTRTIGRGLMVEPIDSYGNKPVLFEVASKDIKEFVNELSTLMK